MLNVYMIKHLKYNTYIDLIEYSFILEIKMTSKFEELSRRVDRLYRILEKKRYTTFNEGTDISGAKINDNFEKKYPEYVKLAVKADLWYQNHIWPLDKKLKELKSIKPNKSFFGKIKNQEELDKAKDGISAIENMKKAVDNGISDVHSIAFYIQRLSEDNDYSSYKEIYNAVLKVEKGIEQSSNLVKSIQKDADVYEAFNKAIEEAKEICKGAKKLLNSDLCKQATDQEKRWRASSKKTHDDYEKAAKELSDWQTKVRNAIIDGDYSDPEVRKAIKDYGKQYFGVYDR